jgi:hypothetical protein
MLQDIGIGILLSLFVAHLFDSVATPGLIVLGVVFALLPDIDLLVPQSFSAWIGGHRGLTHYPIIYLIISVVLFFVAPPLIATLFALAVFYHLLHDSFILGWGIAWLWPFSPRKFKWGADKNGEIVPVMLAWLPHEEARVRQEYSTSHWIRTFYARPTFISITEYGIFLISLLALYYYFF